MDRREALKISLKSSIGIAGAISLGSIFISCDSDKKDESKADSKDSTQNTQAQSAQAQSTQNTQAQGSSNLVKIGYLPITDHLLIIADNLYPNTFSPLKFSSWADISQSFSAGSVDAAFLLAPLALKVASQNTNIKAVMAGHRNGSVLVVGKDSNINDVAGLKGKKIAIPSRFSIHYLLLVDLLKQHNISQNDVTLVDMAPPEMLFSLKSKAIDAYIVAEPFGVQAQKADIGKALLLSKDIKPNHICCILCVSDKLYKDSNTLKNLIENFAKTAVFIESNPDKAADISQKYLGQKPDIIDAIIKNDARITYKNLVIAQSEIDSIAKECKELNLGDLNRSGFLDTSIIESISKA